MLVFESPKDAPPDLKIKTAVSTTTVSICKDSDIFPYINISEFFFDVVYEKTNEKQMVAPRLTQPFVGWSEVDYFCLFAFRALVRILARLLPILLNWSRKAILSSSSESSDLNDMVKR